MSSILTSQGMVLATAMAVSGTVILLAFRLQKSTHNQLSLLVNAIPPAQSPESLPRSCICASAAPPCSSPSSSSSSDGKKKKDKKKKRVHFAADVVDPTGNSDDYRKNFHSSREANTSNSLSSSSSSSNYSGKAKGMPANRIALYNGMLRDRVLHRTTYSY